MVHKVFSRCLFYAALLLLFSAAACNMPMPTEAAGSSTPTPTATSTSTATPTGTPTGTPTATPTFESTATATATIVHLLTPGAPPASYLSEINDHDSSLTASQRRTTASESYAFNRYERPFNAESMDIYFQNLDIKRARLSMDGTWIYVTIQLVGTDPDGSLTGNYGVELDLNVDGRGDVLVFVSALQPIWSTDGVWVWKDNDHDVGRSRPLLPDAPTDGDGYETLVFDQGFGSDPDAAWGRAQPGDPAGVQLAFKRSLLSNDGTFLWGAWADGGVFEPGWYDYNDHFTHTEAGSPLTELSDYYPIKALFEVDNTCRWSVGFTPVGSEPGICPVGGTQGGTPTRTSTPTRTYTPGGPSLTPTRTPTRSNTPFQPNATPTSTRTRTPTRPPTGPSSTPTPTPTLNCAAAASVICTPTPSNTPAGVPGAAGGG